MRRKYLVRAYLLDGSVFEDTIEAKNKRDAVAHFLDLWEDELIDHEIDYIDVKKVRDQEIRKSRR